MPDMIAAELIRDGLCDGNCLLASGPPTTCDCACKGRWHGRLGHTPVPETAAWRTPRPPPQPGPHLLDELELTTA
jgi:hypothetical protein